MFSLSPATTDPGVFSISSPSLVSADVTIADVTIAADGADTRATAGSSSVARTGGSAGGPRAAGPVRCGTPCGPERLGRSLSGNGCVPWQFHFFAIGREPERAFDAYVCWRSL